MTKKNIQVALRGTGRMMVLWAWGGHGFDYIAGSGMSRGRWRHGLQEDDDTACPGTAWVDDVLGLGRMMLL
jgi:hypothetical protein